MRRAIRIRVSAECESGGVWVWGLVSGGNFVEVQSETAGMVGTTDPDSYREGHGSQALRRLRIHD